jgi:zinc D-Ala-D-Ala dipeptidase
MPMNYLVIKVLILFLFGNHQPKNTKLDLYIQQINSKSYEIARNHDTTMVELLTLDKSFVLDVRYATKDNFTGQVLYPCGRVWLRRKVALDLILAQQQFKAKGYCIKIFDGYRPISVQWKLWKIAPKGYVSHPAKGMRMHNRGAAVDMTLIDATGKELDMGTAYDFLGKAAHLNYPHTKEVQANRKLLKDIMQSVGFKAISNEWWHFDYHRMKFEVSDKKICE